jgi:uncharacterized membrane protein YqgA involved in biofilm formation
MAVADLCSGLVRHLLRLGGLTLVAIGLRAANVLLAVDEVLVRRVAAVTAETTPREKMTDVIATGTMMIDVATVMTIVRVARRTVMTVTPAIAI